MFRSGQPIPIEYLPAEHTLDSRVRLLIKYQERPTTTIAVGDPLQFKLETQDGENLLRDIFATNVIAKVGSVGDLRVFRQDQRLPTTNVLWRRTRTATGWCS